MNIGDFARRHAATLESPAVGSAGISGALVRGVATIGIGFYALIGLVAGGGVTVLTRSSGLWLAFVLGASYLRWFCWIYFRRLRGIDAYWATQPSRLTVTSTWVGVALVAWSFVGSFGMKVPFLDYVHVNVGALFSILLLTAFYGAPLGIGVLIAVAIRRAKSQRAGVQVHVPQVRRNGRAAPASAPAWTLAIGTATGFARGRNDAQGAFAGDIVSLALQDAARGVLLAGAPGSGKTTLMRSIARQSAALTGTALVAISAKRDDARMIARMCSRPITIGPGNSPFALFAGLSPEAIGGVFGQLAGDPRNPFWQSAVANLVSAWMQILSGLAGSTVVIPEQQASEDRAYEQERILTLGYNAESLSDVIYSSSKTMHAVLLEAARRLPSLDGTQHEQLSAGLRYFAGEYQATLETARGETLGGVRASVSPYLRALTTPAFCEAFSTGDIDLASAIDGGAHLVIDVDMAESPQGFAVASSFVLAHLRKIALSRTSRTAESNNPCVLLCDEFGTYASAEHLPLFETCRQANIAAVVSCIGLSNLQARLGEAGAYSIASALASIIVFSTGDHATRKYVTERIGSVRVVEITAGSSAGRGQTLFMPQTSFNTSEHYVQQPVIDDAAWSNLGVRRDKGYASAVSIISIGGGVQHDVVLVQS